MTTSVEYEGKQYNINDGETVLQALLRQGANLAYSCGKGSCYACILKLEDGTVESSRSLDETLEKARHFLPCVSTAIGKVAVAPADLSALSKPAEVVSRRMLTDDILELGIAPMSNLDFAAGQHVHLENDAGLPAPVEARSRRSPAPRCSPGVVRRSRSTMVVDAGRISTCTTS